MPEVARAAPASTKTGDMITAIGRANTGLQIFLRTGRVPKVIIIAAGLPAMGQVGGIRALSQEETGWVTASEMAIKKQADAEITNPCQIAFEYFMFFAA